MSAAAVLLSAFVLASPPGGTVVARMHATGSWKEGCPVPIEQLELVHVRYLDFQGQLATGELVVHAKVASGVSKIFSELLAAQFRIEKMRLIDEYGADDDRSAADDNTSAFNCRPITGLTGQFSRHSYGMAIDLNPAINPYIKPKTPEEIERFKQGIPPWLADSGLAALLNAFCLSDLSRCQVLPATSGAYVLRSEDRPPGTVYKGGPVYKAFTSRGWIWGGEWPANRADRVRTDYQHFEKRD